MTLLWFYFALALRLGAAITLRSGAYTAWVLLSFLDLISCAFGIIGLVRLLVFDMGINRTRVRVPLIMSDLLHLAVVVIVLLAIIVHYAKGEVGDTVRPVSTPLTQSSRVYFGGFAPDFPHYISGQEF